ncbi:hypothetical protein C5C45_13215 [Rathayibacter rathayi]|uniref:Conjugal transfer protein n=1 Tax=Rathayibacter rathayi TaxID=33887 RepID=A0ABD6W6S4_RATRA|nr:conjugal transfer protein [Rathayibacter rathayi]PPF11952.1 hypothetical protein C5C04_11485 [Rathayibacter rathayi]PPF45191.1 hypothetical protein C5C08_12615 [Rathayibacter rathayi]PPF77700.1 hypothetical protein C5C14_12025 [Rathayibacter rathayi]PPG11569.1 hypothetical protein C5C11_12180 [Rathayibacter rathayi]PPG37827.1 hypothetical protein C5C20_13440 [Rathayibacter rathayi]
MTEHDDNASTSDSSVGTKAPGGKGDTIRRPAPLRHLFLLRGHSHGPTERASAERPREPAETTEDPWKPAVASSQPRWWLVIRIAVLTVLGILAFGGFLTVIRGAGVNDTPAQTVSGEPAAAEYAARAVAERYTESYFTWDEKAPEARRSALNLDVEQTGAAATAASSGWDGHGRQSAGAARATDVHWDGTGTSTTGTVTVVFRRVGYEADGSPQPAEWWSAIVPITARDGRISISGAPGLVPVEPSQIASADPQPDSDSEVQSATQDYAKTFFAAFAAQSDVSAVAAPGSAIRGMAGAMKLEKVESWTVLPGADEDSRIGHARLAWKTGNATYINDYTVKLTRTKAGGNEKWLISSINGVL